MTKEISKSFKLNIKKSKTDFSLNNDSKFSNFEMKSFNP